MSKQSGKKLVEILAVELKQWPKKVVAYFQWANGEVFATSKGIPTEFKSGMWQVADSSIRMAYGCPLYDTELELAVDHDTAIVTRDQWEAERAKLEGEKVMRACVEKCEPESKPKANAQGWVRNRGRKNPFDVCTLVDVRLRSGEVVTGKFSENLHWVHTGNHFDVMAYRVNKSVEAEAPEVAEAIDSVVAQNVDAFNARAEMPAAKYFDGPIQWRDRIAEIDRTVEALEEERESLIQKLADEGLKLKSCATIGDALNALEKAGLAEAVQYVRSRMSESLDSFVTRLSADEFGALFKLESAELPDMSDWRNWREGDLITCTTSAYPDIFTQGKSYPVKEVKESGAVVFDDCEPNGCCTIGDMHMDKFKFHSRPNK